ncbi:apolipoprotein B receptor [Chionomys nivalis]|uniref:apolipoprotein B receptor n=1 Tax=Chionomys nivalis TaxID=269649 RepID=UPI002592AAC4|nr:apolipoprotein B receptor [Chionomys nivalis]
MDFLRLHLPGLHQALRGALDSFSAFVSYLIGDTVPTVERERQAAEELGEVAAGKPGKFIQEEAQEALEGFRSDQSQRVGAPREVIRCQAGSLAGEQAWGWRADSSPRPRAEKQDTGSRKAAEGARGQEPNAPLKPEAGPGTQRDRNSKRAQEIWEHGEQEVNSGEPLRTCEQKEEEEEVVRGAEPGMARGVELSQPAWHREPEGNAGPDRQNVTEDSKETDWMAKEAVTETKGFEAKGADKEEERIVLVRDGQSAGAQGAQHPGAESEAMLDRKAWRVSGREDADDLGIREADYGLDSEDSIPEATGRVWVLEEACQGEQPGEIDEKREAEARHQPQTLETERTEEMTEGQIVGKETVGDQEMQGSFEGEERQDLAPADRRVSLEEEMQAEEFPEEERGYGTTEAVLALDKEAKCEPDLEDSPEARPEELFMAEESEATQMRLEVLRVKVTEGQDPELLRGSQTLTEHLEEGQQGQEETRRAPDLSPEGALSLEDCLRPVGFADPELEAQENQRRDVDNRNTQDVKADAEEEEDDDDEEIATGQAVEVEVERGQESQQPEIPGWGAEAEAELTSIAVDQELEGSQGAEAATGQSVGEFKPMESKTSEGEAAVPWETNRMCRKRSLEEVALSLQDSDMQTSSSEAEISMGIRTVGAEEGPEWEAGVSQEREFGRAPHSKGRGETGGGMELEEATEIQSGQEVASENSVEEKAPSYDIQEIGGTGEREQADMGTSGMAEGMTGIDGVTLGSQAEKAEGSITIMETEGRLGDQMPLEEEAGRGLSREWEAHNSERETQKLHDVEDAEREAQRTEVQENDPEPSDQERHQTHQIPTITVPGFSESGGATASAPEDAHSWNEALLPGTLLDVSVPRSRVLLSRSSSRRRSRPSLRRISAPEPQYDPPSPQPQEELFQPEETSELSATRPVDTPVPARRKMLGPGFGFAHPGMMQELQARLSRPKPQ